MEDQEKIKFICPHCQAKVESNSHSTINVTLNPELKEKLFSGEIFVKECSQCKEKIQVLHSFLYHDLDNKVMISFGDEAEHVQELMQDLRSEMKENDLNIDAFYADYRIRATKDINDVFEKIYIFDEDLDDRVIEFCKILVVQNMVEAQELKPEDILDVRYLPNKVLKENEEIDKDAIAINVYCKEDKAWIKTLNKNFYDQCANYVLNSTKKDDLASNLVIDHQWLKNNLEEN